MGKNKELEKDKVLFRAIEEEETCIKAKHKFLANFLKIKSNAKPQGKTYNGKKAFVRWSKCKKIWLQTFNWPGIQVHQQEM